MKNKYLIQKDDYSCGVYATLNSLIYFGKKYVQKDIQKYIPILNCDKEYGTDTKDIRKFLKLKGFKLGNLTRKYNPNEIYLALYQSYSRGYTFHYIIIIPEKIAINFHKFNSNKMYKKYKLSDKWLNSRLKSNKIDLWKITKLDKNL